MQRLQTIRLLMLATVMVAAATRAVSPVMAQDGPACPDYPGSYGPPGGPTDRADMATDPLPDALARIANCEVALIPATTAIVRALYSDDPALRPALRRVVDAWRHQSTSVPIYSYVALAALGESGDYFVDEVERALAADQPSVARDAAEISAFFPDSARYNRLVAISASHGSGLALGRYWTFSEDLPYDESGELDYDEFLALPVQVAVDEVLLGLFDIGFSARYGERSGSVAFVANQSTDSLTPNNVLLSVALRALGVRHADSVRVAIAASPVFAAEVARLGGSPEREAALRRGVLSAFLPGESLTSDVFDPPADTSLIEPFQTGSLPEPAHNRETRPNRRQ